MIKRCFLLMLSTVSLAVLAQMKQFTLDDLIPGGTTYSSLQPTSLNVTWWGNQLLKPEEKVCSIRNKKGEWQTLFTLEELHAAMEQAGIAYATEQIIDLVSNGVRGIHLYTMNRPDIAGQIMKNLSHILGKEQ